MSLGSGRGTLPTFGSIVQKGKFSAGIEDFVNALKSVDLPTLGSPTMPHLKPIIILYEEISELQKNRY
jgi:hypothetical protein